MRTRYNNTVEKGRIVTGHFRSIRGDRHGAFFLQQRNGTGRLKIIASPGDDDERSGWDHVSVSLARRCPTWDEMTWIKHLFFEPDEVVIQIHPRVVDYVNDHPYCLHLWRPTAVELPTPPPILVGLGRKSTKGGE